LPGVFPPLAGSEWVLGKEATLARILLHGINGSLTVKGSTYNGAMPAFKEQLQDAEIAAVLSHVRSQWGNQGAVVAPEVVATARKDTAARTEPFKGDAELAPLK
jgi:mono/diheme cytochrome c family protein